jgi:sugar transferase (PEP-CTERM/EpsH1 system associated)
LATSTTVLVVTHGVPYPPHGGAKLRDLNTIRCLAREHSVCLLSLVWDPQELRDLPRLREYCDHVDAVSTRRSVGERMVALGKAVVSARPLAAAAFYRDEMARKIRRLLEERRVDLVVFEQIYVAPYIDALPAPRTARTVLSLHNVAAHQYRSMVGTRAGGVHQALAVPKWRLISAMERRYTGLVDHCIVVSAREAGFLRAMHPHVPTSVVENGVDTVAYRPLEEPDGGNALLFVGRMQYAPNVDAVRYVCRRILPAVRRVVPDARLYVVGPEPPRLVTRLAGDDAVVVTGGVPDVRPYYQRARIAIVPLRAGGGTRLKILEAMALGRAVVSTSIGCEGLEVRDREHLLIADTDASFAAGVIELLQSRDLRERLARNARRLVESRYDWEIVNRTLSDVYRRVLAP